MKGLSERGKYWQGLVAEQAAGGANVRAFCADRGVSEPSFYWWRRELQGLNTPGRRTRETAKSKAGFVELVVSPVTPASRFSGVAVHLDARVSILLDRGFDREVLAAVLTVLKEPGPCSH